MAQIADGGGRKETAAQRNARLQAAFNKTSTSTKMTTRRLTSYVPAPSYKAPSVPKTTSYNVQAIQSLAPAVPKTVAPAVPSPTYDVQAIQSLAPTVQGTPGTGRTVSGATPTEQWAAQGGRQVAKEITPYSDPVQQSTWQRSIDFVSQGSTQTYEDQLVASAARLTGAAIFNYGQIPNVISATVANQLPYTHYGYASADAFLEDLGYFEQAPGQWIQGEGGGTTGAGSGTTQSGTFSYQQALTGGGYAGRYSGASTGLINWRIGS